MIKTKKRNGLFKLLSYVLALASILSLAAIGVSATSIVDSGTCGENLTWTLDSEGSLKISGTGEMDSMKYSDASIWCDFGESINKIVIGYGVTSIDSCSFSGFSNLTEVKIPDSITHIGFEAFRFCDSLTDITIPSSVISIEGGVFDYCNFESMVVESGNNAYHSDNNCIIETDSKTLIAGCKNSVIPSDGSVTKIKNGAFTGCPIKYVNIPDSIVSLENAFRDCTDIESITVENENTKYLSKGNCLIDNDTKTLILGCKNSIIPTDGCITRIGDYAFRYCHDIKNVVIPSGVTDIGEFAFDGCFTLGKIEIPESVTSIGMCAFCNCGLRSVVLPSGITTINSHTFSYCKSLVKIVIPKSVTYISDYSFYSCDNLTFVHYSGTENEWNNIDIENGNESLLDADITYNSNGNVEDTADFTYNIVPSRHNMMIDVAEIIGYTGTSEDIAIPEIIDDYLVEQIDISEMNSNVRKLTIPRTVTRMGLAPFYGFMNLEYITVSDDNSVYASKDGVVYSKDFKTLAYYPYARNERTFAVDDNIEKIYADAFRNCKYLEKISLSKSVKNIYGMPDGYIIVGSGVGTFINCKALIDINVDESNEYYASKDGILYNKDFTQLIRYPSGRKTYSYSIEPNVKSLASSAFSDCKALNSITVLSDAININGNVFESCTNLKSIYLPKNTKSIYYGAFTNCESLETVYYSGTEEDWGNIWIDEGRNEYLLNANIIYNYNYGGEVHVHTFPDSWTCERNSYPTRDADGMRYRICKTCGEREEAILPKLQNSSLAFGDLTADWYKQSVDYVLTKDLMDGTGGGMFAPEENMTRAQFATVLWRIAGEPKSSSPAPFTDLDKNADWYLTAVAWAYENGIIKGTSPTTFDPDGNIKRQDMATILFRYAGEYKRYDVSARADLSSFPDVESVDSYAADPVSWTNAVGIIVGKDGLIAPQAFATRAEVATILMRFDLMH